jgi:hypothetical protein
MKDACNNNARTYDYNPAIPPVRPNAGEYCQQTCPDEFESGFDHPLNMRRVPPIFQPIRLPQSN